MIVSEADVRVELDYLVAIEPDPDAIASIEEYRSLLEPHAARIAATMATLRAYAEQRSSTGGAELRTVYHFLVNDSRYAGRPVAQGVVSAALNEAWDGVGGWQR